MGKIIETTTRYHLDDDGNVVMIEFISDGEVIQVTPEDMIASADLYARENLIDVLVNQAMAEAGIDPDNAEARAEAKSALLEVMTPEVLEESLQRVSASMRQSLSGNSIMKQSMQVMRMAKLAHERRMSGVA
jgi:hypothetical protein